MLPRMPEEKISFTVPVEITLVRDDLRFSNFTLNLTTGGVDITENDEDGTLTRSGKVLLAMPAAVRIDMKKISFTIGPLAIWAAACAALEKYEESTKDADAGLPASE